MEQNLVVDPYQQSNPSCRVDWGNTGAENISIKPSQVVNCNLIPVKHPLIDKDPLPLAALGFMTRHCIGKFDLEGIEIFIALHSFKLLSSCFNMKIIIKNIMEQFTILF